MNIDYEPWGESHAPQRFERTDKSGRWSPIQDEVPDEPFWFAIAGGITAGVFFAFMLFWGTQ